jgi:Uma2 family endonuclease
MAILITDPGWEAKIKAEREASGDNGRDEVWDGVWFMPPLPNNEHQALAMMLGGVFMDVVGWPGLGQVYGGINLSDRAADWKDNYREPDVAVVLNGSTAVNHQTHWQGAVDFLVEIVSPDDRSREKLPFYSSLGVREVLVIDRQPWQLELYRLKRGRLGEVGRSTVDAPDVVSSAVLPLAFQLVPGTGRPNVRVAHPAGGKEWTA